MNTRPSDELGSFDSLIVQEGDRAAYAKEDVAPIPRLPRRGQRNWSFLRPDGAAAGHRRRCAACLRPMPAFGAQDGRVPAGLTETWFKAEAEGLYYGQCSELCRKDHAIMPICGAVVARDQFDAWRAAAVDDVEAANRNLMAANRRLTPVGRPLRQPTRTREGTRPWRFNCPHDDHDHKPQGFPASLVCIPPTTRISRTLYLISRSLPVSSAGPCSICH